MMCAGPGKAPAAPKQEVSRFRCCCWRCRCTPIQVSSIACRRIAVGSSRITHVWITWSWAITPHQRMSLCPTSLLRLLQALLQEVHWISLESSASSQQFLASRPDLETVVLSMLVQTPEDPIPLPEASELFAVGPQPSLVCPTAKFPSSGGTPP